MSLTKVKGSRHMIGHDLVLRPRHIHKLGDGRSVGHKAVLRRHKARRRGLQSMDKHDHNVAFMSVGGVRIRSPPRLRNSYWYSGRCVRECLLEGSAAIPTTGATGYTFGAHTQRLKETGRIAAQRLSRITNNGGVCSVKTHGASNCQNI